MGLGGPLTSAPVETPDGASSEEFQVVLVSAGDKPISIIKLVREATRLGLAESKNLFDGVPSVIARGLDTEAAQRLATDLTKAGATAEVRESEPVEPVAPVLPQEALPWLVVWLQPNETVEATMRTAALISKKDVVFTSSRILVADVADDPRVETTSYDSIASFRGDWNWLTQQVTLNVAGTRREIILRFASREDHDRALAILNRHIS
jgi:Ribosomal protein L7/L12 C-terminal domain